MSISVIASTITPFNFCKHNINYFWHFIIWRGTNACTKRDGWSFFSRGKTAIDFLSLPGTCQNFTLWLQRTPNTEFSHYVFLYLVSFFLINLQESDPHSWHTAVRKHFLAFNCTDWMVAETQKNKLVTLYWNCLYIFYRDPGVSFLFPLNYRKSASKFF